MQVNVVVFWVFLDLLIGAQNHKTFIGCIKNAYIGNDLLFDQWCRFETSSISSFCFCFFSIHSLTTPNAWLKLVLEMDEFVYISNDIFSLLSSQQDGKKKNSECRRNKTTKKFFSFFFFSILICNKQISSFFF